LPTQVALLVALAKVLAELDTVEEAVLQQCLHVIERVVQAYRGLWPKQRLPVHAALNIFLSAIAPKQAVLQSVLPWVVSILLTYTLKPAEANLIAGDSCLLCISKVPKDALMCRAHCYACVIQNVIQYAVVQDCVSFVHRHMLLSTLVLPMPVMLLATLWHTRG